MTSDTKARLLAAILSALSLCSLACGVFAVLHTTGQWVWQLTGGLAAAGSLAAAVVFFCTMIDGSEEGEEDLAELEEAPDEDQADWWKYGHRPDEEDD